MRRSKLDRRGAVLAAALVCLLLVLLYAAAVARAMSLRQREVRTDEHEMQCFWLAESALGRAVAKSRTDPVYSGESWRMMAKLDGRDVAGLAIIHVEPAGDAGDLKRIQIDVVWPDDPVSRIMRTKELIIPRR